ncbi:spore germination protein [Aneurinibacillus aneurinilyticus]|uniref:Spore germination protein n=2 Tax=Aneurinibacillus aneurinilyticus TaxID=1391 RepID=A0A848CTK2_ANEAE|nr:spore germination protein [Aneurinibacillus aneurinilyticus]ERI11376.1 putative spore germination protein gerPF [Aneurinibacillus aneurinilyticus ATCC 12856]MED0673696.1 spore germination protein [Aneurinibacillus aneurinilyticus]MED0708825.1 spore germination protein [Aneurinibacillus aneurinilyticus]MED0722851.1 spore germination protein [Aneurinibacillus aneurinilyticus]MED0742892.1 spore germination protein [Aneurinibacillus aneurinilyticus]
MSSFVGFLNILTMDHGSSIVLEESLIISPKSSARTNSGSGSGNTANFMENFNGINSTNTEEPHVADQNIAGIV